MENKANQLVRLTVKVQHKKQIINGYKKKIKQRKTK